MKLRRPEPITFERADGSLTRVPPLSRGQMRRLYDLEKEDPETGSLPKEVSDLRALRLEIMLERAACADGRGESMSLKWFLELLTPEEEIDIINGLIAHHHGLDVAHAVDLQAAMRDLVKKKIRAHAASS